MLGANLAGLLFIVAVLTARGREVRLTASGWSGFSGGWRLVGAGLLAGSQSVMTIAYALIATGVFARFRAGLAGRLWHRRAAGTFAGADRLWNWRCFDGRDRDASGGR